MRKNVEIIDDKVERATKEYIKNPSHGNLIKVSDTIKEEAEKMTKEFMEIAREKAKEKHT